MEKRLLLLVLLFLINSFCYSQPAEDNPKNSSLLNDELESKKIRLFEGKWQMVQLTGEGDRDSGRLPEVNLYLQYDKDSLRINAVVKDDHFRDSERGWRYGDGFLINFAFPGTDDSIETENFYAYGFSLENKKPLAILVNKDGNYFLKRQDKYSPRIVTDTIKHEALYNISLPWKALYPFNPLFDQTAGINIIYISQNNDRSRKIIKYVDDPYYDTELTKKRRFARLDFIPSENSGMQIACELGSRFQTVSKSELKVVLFFSHKSLCEINYSIADSTGKIIINNSFSEELSSGRNIIRKEIQIPVTDGAYLLTVNAVHLEDSVFWSDSFYRFNNVRLSKFKEEIRKLNTKKEQSRHLLQSIPVLEYYLSELESSISRFNKRKDPLDIKRRAEELDLLLARCYYSGSVYTQSGYMLSAFRQESDSTLQPFSIYLPEAFDPAKTYNLLVTLHGSGEDELWMVKFNGKELAGKNNIVIGPRGRNLSSWYTGKTESDIIQLIMKIKELVNINKTVLYGFSMGGYGTWRFSFLHPELFDGAIIISGIPFNLNENVPENDIRNLLENNHNRAKKLPFLVIHGTDDHSLDVKYTDEFVARLEKDNYDIRYVRIPGGGHGNFKSSDIIKEWLNNKQLLY